MDPLLMGHARRVITPHVPVSLAGYFNLRMWTGVLDDILVQAVALQQGDQMAVLVQFDLVSASREFMDAVRRECADIGGLTPENMLFTASHTHTAPEIRAFRPGGSAEYNRSVITRASEAVHAACRDLTPGDLAVGSASDDRFAFNRRYWMASGEVVTNPPRRDPGIDRPEGPIDPEIGLVTFRRRDGVAILFANVVNHADTTTGCLVSGDWPGALRRSVEASAPDLRVVPLIGTSGNINHFDPNGPDEQSGPHVAKRIGEGYAESVLAALGDLCPSPSPALQATHSTFVTGPREIEPDELAMAEEHAARYRFDDGRTLTSEDLATRSPAALKYFADAVLAVAKDRRDRELELHALRVGDALILTVPGEPFVEIGLKIKSEIAPGHPTLVAALNQDVGYIPNRFNFGGGGYETTPRCSPYSIETADHLLDGVEGLLGAL